MTMIRPSRKKNFIRIRLDPRKSNEKESGKKRTQRDNIKHQQLPKIKKNEI